MLGILWGTIWRCVHWYSKLDHFLCVTPKRTNSRSWLVNLVFSSQITWRQKEQAGFNKDNCLFLSWHFRSYSFKHHATIFPTCKNFILGIHKKTISLMTLPWESPSFHLHFRSFTFHNISCWILSLWQGPLLVLGFKYL